MWTVESNGSLSLALGVGVGGSRWTLRNRTKKMTAYFTGIGAGVDVFDSSAKFQLPPAGELFFTNLMAYGSDQSRSGRLNGSGYIVDYGIGKVLLFTDSSDFAVGVIRLATELPLVAATATYTKRTPSSSLIKAFAFLPTGDVKAQVKVLWGNWVVL